MSALMNSLTAAAPDPLLGLMAAVRADDRPEKIDLGVGIYKDAQGGTPVMAAVKLAEEQLLRTETTKAYEGPHGNALYCEKIDQLVFGEMSSPRTVFATPGGSGALAMGLSLAKLMSKTGRLFISDPAWPNHLGIGKAVGFEIVRFPYVPMTDGSPDSDQLFSGLSSVTAGDIVLLQGPCHNPTGTDLHTDQWIELARMVVDRGAFPFVDVAYQGFAQGLDADILPVQTLLSRVPEAIVTYSCSKNFGLYRERTGALMLQAPGEQALDAVRSQAAAIIRTAYSMPPAHGAAIVATVLDNPQLYTQWTDELNAMRRRLNTLRSSFGHALAEAAGDETFLRVAAEKGMFSVLPLPAGAAERLRDEAAIYLPGSGRVNIAGLTEERVDDVAKAIVAVL